MSSDEEVEMYETLPAAERRVRAMIDALLEDKGLSDEARKILLHLNSSDRKLADTRADELADLLLEGHR